MRYAFVAPSGIRLGCLLSSDIFVIITDPINRAVLLRIPRSGTLCAFADDLAIVLAHLWRHAPALAILFTRIALISNLRLNHPRCLIVPLGTPGNPKLLGLLLLRCSRSMPSSGR